MINLLNQVKAYFYVRPSTSKNKRGTFYVRVTIDKEQLTASVKSLELYEHEFDVKTQNPKPTCQMYMEVTDFMTSIKRELYRIHNDYQKNRMVFTKQDLKNAVQEVYHRLRNGQQQNAKTFLDVFEEFMVFQKTRVGKIISRGTYDIRCRYQKKLKEVLIKLKMHGLPILNYTKKDCEKIQSTLLASDLNKNYVGRIMSVVNMVFKFARNENYIYENPYAEVQTIKIDKCPNLFWLEPHEIAKIKEVQLDGTTARLRDAFVFCCYTGLAIGDYELLNPKKSKETIKLANSPRDIQPGRIIQLGEKKILSGRRRKTGTLFRVPLSEEALNILNNYGGIENLPFGLYSNGQVLNLIAGMAGISAEIRFHTARKSFANYLLNHKQLNPYYVKDIMGWVKIEESEPYTRVSNDTLISQLL